MKLFFATLAFLVHTFTMAAAARTINILGVSGSLRKASVNTQLLNIIGKEAGTEALAGVNFSVADISDLPMYNSDLEETKVCDAGAAECDGCTLRAVQHTQCPPLLPQDDVTTFPPTVEAFRAQVAAADAFVFATTECVRGRKHLPESSSSLPPLLPHRYNYGISGPLKNAIDWASRGGNPMADKAAAMVGEHVASLAAPCGDLRGPSASSQAPEAAWAPAGPSTTCARWVYSSSCTL